MEPKRREENDGFSTRIPFSTGLKVTWTRTDAADSCRITVEAKRWRRGNRKTADSCLGQRWQHFYIRLPLVVLYKLHVSGSSTATGITWKCRIFPTISLKLKRQPEFARICEVVGKLDFKALLLGNFSHFRIFVEGNTTDALQDLQISWPGFQPVVPDVPPPPSNHKNIFIHGI